jgi:hypothetical protein
MLARENNTTFFLELEKRKIKYIAGIAKNRKVIIATEESAFEEIRLDNLAQSIPNQAFTRIQANARKHNNCVGCIY